MILRLTYIVALVCLGLCLSPHTRGETPLHPEIRRLILEGTDLTFRQEYQAADSVFRHLTEQFPDHPAGYLYQAGLRQTIAVDYQEELKRDGFDSLLTLGLRKAEVWTKQYPNSPWGNFFQGTALGYESYASAFRGDWFRAVRKALTSVKEFRSSLERDSSLLDPYAGIGTYLYWKSRKTEFLNWIPLIHDERDEGMRLLSICADRGDLNSTTAISLLVSLHLDRGDVRSAEVYARRAVARYPTNRIFQWGLAAALEKGEKRAEAIAVYESLFRSITTDPRGSAYNELVCRLNLVRLKLELKDTTLVSHHLAAIAALEGYRFPDYLKRRVRQKFDEASSLKRRLLSQKPD